MNENTNNTNDINGSELVKNTLDEIPEAKCNAKRITGLVKENGRVTGYQLSDDTIVEKPQAVQMAKQRVSEIIGQLSGEEMFPSQMSYGRVESFVTDLENSLKEDLELKLQVMPKNVELQVFSTQTNCLPTESHRKKSIR